MKLKTTLTFCLGFLYYTSFANAGEPQAQPIEVISTQASSVYKSYDSSLAVDGKISDDSRWVGGPDAEGNIWLEVTFSKQENIAGIHLFSGYGNESPLSHFHFEFLDDAGNWTAIPSARLSSNPLTALRLPFDTTVDVVTNKLRLVVRETKDGLARVKELRVWRDGEKGVPELKAEELPEGATADAAIPEIYLNQSGFNLNQPKRFTAPTLPDGTPFGVYQVGGETPLFSGTIKDNLGDFSDFNPTDGGEYVVKAGGHTSVPFTIGLWQLERITYQNAVDFMIDSRHYVGNYTKPCRGSFGWRDDHAFAWALRTLVPQYLSNPAAYERMPQQIRYEAPRNNLWGALEPYPEDAPDIVKLIHWGADVTVSQKTTHEFLKGELAYFLYAWPLLKEWLPQQNYDAVLKFVQDTWAQTEADREYPYDTSPEHNLFALKTQIGTTKGEYPPGHSVMPNLLMYAVAERDGLPDAEPYFDATYRQVEWMVEHLDWEDPQTTKGQRMSEHITMTGLAAFQQLYPERAPKGLQAKIEAWADVVIRRSDNMWDFRRLTDDGQWTPSGAKRTMWNEVGNVVGLPSAILSALPFVEDKNERQRLREIVWSHFDNAFGRNPTGRHFSYDAPREIEGVEHGWYTFHDGGIGQLADARFVLDGAPKHVHYPYNPEQGNYGWSEGWIQFNTAYNLSLAYLARAKSELSLVREGDDVVVRLRAPLNFDKTKAEPVTLKLHGPKSAAVTLTEVAPTSPDYIGRIPLEALDAEAGDRISASYGFGYMATTADLRLEASTPDLVIDRSVHRVAVNQVGYETGRPKRFTAPLSPDGTRFILTRQGGSDILYEGSIENRIGDFSDFRPADSSDHYVLTVSGSDLRKGHSDPFLIRKDLYREQFAQSAVDFFIDTRSVVGTHPSAFGGCPWRDGTYYDAIIPSLALFYLANKDTVDAMPRQIDWLEDKNRVLAPDFTFDARNPHSDHVMDNVRAYYELEPPHPDAPDLVKLIHWGAGYYLVNPVTADPSGDPLGWQVHSQTIEQLAYVLWAWPMLEAWLPQSFYDQVRDLCFEQWESMGALDIPELWHMSTYQENFGDGKANPWKGRMHPYKGRHAPGHSIVPNLIMHEVAKREGRNDAEHYLDAAVMQAQWIIDNIDWNDPRTTKGHRMSEHRTITNLVWLLQNYPEQAPDGLLGKITHWSAVVVARSDNIWDFRRYDLKDHWTIPKLNDVGNTIGFPSLALAASWVVEDEHLKSRLQTLAAGAVDHLFGRNPRMAAGPSRPQQGFPEVDRGWPIEHKLDVCARLETVRGSISTLPGTEMYPFNPEGKYRHAEGWVNYGAAWCISLSYLEFDRIGRVSELTK